MNTKFVSILALTAVAGAAGAQLTGFRVSAGYGWTGSITDSGGVGRHMSGPILTGTVPLSHLPVVDIGFRGEVLFGGGLGNSSIKGQIWKGLVTGRAQIPGSQIGAWLGMGFGTGQGNSNFASFSGFVTQVGVSFPLGTSTPLVAPAVEVAGNWGSKSGLSGFSVAVSIHF